MVISVSGKMQFELSKERQVRKKKVRTWTEAAKLALELNPKTPMGHKDILNVIRAKGLKDVSGPASLACLNAMLHVHSRGPEAMFYRVDGCTSVFGLASNIPDGGVRMEVDEDESGQDFDPGDSDPDSGASLPPCERKKDRVLYVRLPPGHKNSLSMNNSLYNQPEETVLHKNDQLTVKPLTYKNEYYTRVRRLNGENMEDVKKEKCNQASAANLPVTSPAKVSQSHSQRAIKHALRQQQKRRRRNTAIAASGNAPPPIPRIIMKSLPPAPAGAGCVPEERWRCSLEKTSLRESTRHKPQTMRELLASIPGLSFKPRKRSNRKLSTAAQIAQTKKGCINIETPDSILVNINLRALLNKHTFASLPAVYQYRLVQLLPQADRMISSDYSVRLTGTALSNEFFARACQEWKKRLQEGEFTPENQMKLKGEAERDHSKLDPWKIHNFEPVWGHTSLSDFSEPGKSSPFLMNSQLKPPQTKHVPTIKIKPVVRKSRLACITRNRRVPSQDSPHSDENNPVDSPLYNEALDVDTLAMGENSENIFEPPAKKLKLSETASSNSSESQESSEESLQTVQQSPCPSPSPSSVMSMPSPPQSVEEADSSKETGVVSSDIPISLSITVVQTTAPSQSLVPPITIRSIPVIRSGSGKKCSGRNDGGANLERSYQICKAALESNSKKDATPTSEAATQPVTSDAMSMVTSSVTTSEAPTPMDVEEDPVPEEEPAMSVDCSNPESDVAAQEVPSSTNQLLLTTCLPTTIPSFSLNSVSSTINSLETSNTCTNAEVSSLDSESVGETYEEVVVETQFNLNLPVRMAADSTSVEPDASPAVPSSTVSPPQSPDELKDQSTDDGIAEDPESSCSMSMAMPEYSPSAKEDSSEESNNEIAAAPSEQVVSQDSVLSNNENAETNIVSSSLQNDLSCLPSECLDSDSSSLQPHYNNSQVVDEDSTIILSLPSSEEENVISDDNVAEESIPEKEILIDDTNSKSSNADSSSVSGGNSEPSPAEKKPEICFQSENFEEKVEPKSPCDGSESLPSSDKTQCEELSTYEDEPYPNPSINKKDFDPPSRPLSAPSNFTPVHVSSSAEVSALKRPSSCQSYYRSSKVTPIVYFDSPESDDTRSDCDKGDPALTSSPLSDARSLIAEDSSSSSSKTDKFAAAEKPEDKGAPRSSPLSRASPSSILSMQSLTPVVHRPLLNPIPESCKPPASHPNCNVLPEGCTGGAGGSLPSQAVSVVPASTQLPMASMFPSANGPAGTVGTPAGDTPPRSLLQSSPIINGASEGAGDGGSSSSGSVSQSKVTKRKYFLRKRIRKRNYK